MTIRTSVTTLFSLIRYEMVKFQTSTRNGKTLYTSPFFRYLIKNNANLEKNKGGLSALIAVDLLYSSLEDICRPNIVQKLIFCIRIVNS